jgi:hypothetical protein
MKNNILILALVAGLLVLGFLYMKEKSDPEVLENNVIETNTGNQNNSTNNSSGSSTTTNQNSGNNQSSYNYTNSRFNFSVDLSGVVPTETVVGNSTIINFGNPNNPSLPEESRTPNKLSVTISSDDSIFDDIKAVGEFAGNEMINGKSFEKYTFSIEGNVSYNYLTSHKGLYYRLATLDPINMQEFFLN